MSKTIQGSCNWCGSCCGHSSYTKCALPYAFWKWDKQHPGLGLPLVKAIKSIVGEDIYNVSGRIVIEGFGEVDFYLSKDGLQTTDSNTTCPFYNTSTKECKIWNTFYLPEICTKIPQVITGGKTDKWLKDHPDCSFYWEDS